jgi:hypothetical protein
MNRSKSRSQSKQVLPENEIRCNQCGRCDNSLVAANADEIANISAVIPIWSDGDAFLSLVQSALGAIARLVLQIQARVRRKAKLVSGFTGLPSISSNGYAKKLIGPVAGAGSTIKSRPLVSSNRLAG